MNRLNLEHIIRAAAAIAEDDEIYVFGSQAILGAFPDAPPELTRSMEADVAPKHKPELESLIEGSIGEFSQFHQTFGYYADGVEVAGLILPAGWEQRVVVIQNANTRFAKGLCLEPHDCAVSKLFAGREKDIEFVTDLLRHRLVHARLLDERIVTVSRGRELVHHVQTSLQRLVAAAGE